MGYAVSYSTSVGALATQHQTAAEALDRVRSYRGKGYQSITITDRQTGLEIGQAALERAAAAEGGS